MEITYYRFKCTGCGYSDDFTDLEEAENKFMHTLDGVLCDECVYLTNPIIDRMMRPTDAVDTWTEDYYDEMQADERRAERSEL